MNLLTVMDMDKRQDRSIQKVDLILREERVDVESEVEGVILLGFC